MLSPSKRNRLRNILERVANNKSVTLSERLYLDKVADQDQSVANWLHQARIQQRCQNPKDGLEELINELGLGSADKEKAYNPEEDDLADWFCGAPSWISRT